MGSKISSNGAKLLKLLEKDVTVEEVQEILKSECDVNAKNKRGNTALHIIIKKINKNNKRKMQWHENGTLPPSIPQSGSEFYSSHESFKKAVASHFEKQQKKLTKILMFLLTQEDIDPNVENEKNETPLHLICSFFYLDLDLISHLLEKTTINAQDHEHLLSTPLQMLFTHESLKLEDYEQQLKKEETKHWLSRDKNKCENFQNTVAKYKTARELNITAIRLFLNKDVNVNTADKNGCTFLHNACKNDAPLEFIKILLEFSADPNLKDNDGKTPLHYLCEQRNLAAIKLLILNPQKKTDPNIQDVDGKTSLHCACLEHNCYPNGDERLEVIMFLLENNAGTYLKTHYDGSTPLHILCGQDDFKNTVEPINFLLKTGVDIHITNNLGRTPLMLVCDGFTNFFDDKISKPLSEIILAFCFYNTKGDSLVLSDKLQSTKLDYFIKMWNICADMGEIWGYLREAKTNNNLPLGQCLSEKQRESFYTFFMSLRTLEQKGKFKTPVPLKKYFCSLTLFATNKNANKPFIPVNIEKCFTEFTLKEFKSAHETMSEAKSNSEVSPR